MFPRGPFGPLGRMLLLGLSPMRHGCPVQRGMTREDFGHRMPRGKRRPCGRVRIRTPAQRESALQQVMNANPKHPNIALQSSALNEGRAMVRGADILRRNRKPMSDAQHGGASVEVLL